MALRLPFISDFIPAEGGEKMNSTLKNKLSVVLYCHKKGFSLVEIMVVLGMIVALGTSAIFVGRNYLESGRYSTAKADVSAIAIAVSQYKFEMEEYPQTLNVMTQKVEQYGPWLHEDSLKDPWDRDYQYSFDESNNSFAVWSYGPDGTNASGSNPTEFTGDDIGILGH